LAVTAPQYTDTCPALHDLEAAFRRIEQLSIDQDRPALPRSMRFPALSDTNVNSAITHPHPVIWVSSEVLYTVTIRRRRRHFDEFLDRDYLDIPFNPGEVKISVVAQEPDVIRVVVEELLNDIIWPPQRGDQGVLTEAFEAHAVLPARHRHVPEVSKFHVAHRRPKGLPRRDGCCSTQHGSLRGRPHQAVACRARHSPRAPVPVAKTARTADAPRQLPGRAPAACYFGAVIHHRIGDAAPPWGFKSPLGHRNRGNFP